MPGVIKQALAGLVHAQTFKALTMPWGLAL